MGKSIKDKLEELRKFRTELNSETTSKFDKLLESIKKELPDTYQSKLNVLNIYEYYEEQKFEDDLPF